MTTKSQVVLIKERLREAKNKDAKFVPHDQMMKRQEQKLKKKLKSWQ